MPYSAYCSEDICKNASHATSAGADASDHSSVVLSSDVEGLDEMVLVDSLHTSFAVNPEGRLQRGQAAGLQRSDTD